jgi:UDP-N-acetylglucosamine--N-acetylmuramyl-(pentapeptide) pyrophosphoryl-undecaprenol N-acetylglucosamine transferase
VTKFLLAGGGTAGHVNPMLALAQSLRALDQEVLTLGTKEGLESRLVPQRGFELLTIARLPFPRKPSLYALTFPFKFAAAVFAILKMISAYKIEAVVGFGGYASAPAYLAAFLARKPLVIHEANALAGIANRLGAKFTKNIAVAFPNSDLSPAAITGMPLRPEIVESVSGYDKEQARIELGLNPFMTTLLVTGGSLGAKSINDAIIETRSVLNAAGIQILHIVGDRANLDEVSEPGYRRMAYCDRMDAAIAASDMAVSRAGSSTVSEFAACGLPAIYIPYPVGNGEQRFNAATIVEAGGGKLVSDSEFTAKYISTELIPLVSHSSSLRKMSQAAKSVGIPDATERLRDLVLAAVNTKSRD